jgi:predicted metal-dependent phosphoesterase TrpH
MVQGICEPFRPAQGSVSFKNVKFGVFKELFSRGRCCYVPTNFCNSDASITVTSKDAAAIFGATKAGSRLGG